MVTRTGRRFLTAQDVGRLWGEERAKERGEDPATAAAVSPRTVWAYVWHSTHEEGRYFGFPMPLPEYPNPGLPPAGQHTQWFPPEGRTIADLERDLRHWWNNRPPAGSGLPAGPPRHPAEVIALVRARAEAGARDRDIAAELATRFGSAPSGSAYTPKIVEGIRKRNGIEGGAFHRSTWHVPAAGATSETS